MTITIFRFLLATACLLLSLSLSAAKPVLTIYTYDSFTSDWGPGPKVKTEFEKECDCELKFVGLEDGVAVDPEDEEYALVRTTTSCSSFEIITPVILSSQTNR